MDRRTLLHAGLAAASAAIVSALPGCALRPPVTRSSQHLRLRAYGSLPPTGIDVRGTPVGGLSALTYDAQASLWYALSDDPARRGPVRCYRFRFPEFARQAAIVPRWSSVITLQNAGGGRFARGSVDPEGLALRHSRDGKASTLLWSSEGNIRRRIAPAIYESTLDGRLVRAFGLPPLLTEMDHPGRGPHDNRTLEGIALTPDGRRLWAVMEAPLKQDESAVERQRQDAPRRITRFDAVSGQPEAQVAYIPDAWPSRSALPHALQVNGLSDVLVADDRHLWVLERAFDPLHGFRIRIYEADLNGATNTLGVDRLRAGAFMPVAKRLVLDFSELDLPVIDNFEGMSWGPALPGGRRSLMLVSDNNFNALELTQFVALEVSESPLQPIHPQVTTAS